MNNLKIVVPFYNAEEFLAQCQESLLAQDFNNWSAYLADDCSVDKSAEKVLRDDRIYYKRNERRTTALENIHNTILSSNADDEDIICILDGDDFLFRRNSLSIINQLYNDNTLLTYGQYIWPNGMVGHCTAYSEESFKNLRNGGYWASHMRTFKFKLYKELLKQDPQLNCYKDSEGLFYRTCYDVAIMTPIMEIAGFSNIKFNNQPIYFYRVHSQNDFSVDPLAQKKVEKEISTKTPFRQIF